MIDHALTKSHFENLAALHDTHNRLQKPHPQILLQSEKIKHTNTENRLPF